MWVLVSSRCLRVFSLVNATLSCSFLFSCCSMNTLTFNLSVDVHVGPSPSSTSVFPRFNPTTIFKTSPGTLIFLGWPLNLFSKCAVICCWPPSIFLFLFLFVFFLPKLWQNVTHPLANFPAPFEKETERGRGSGGHWGESLEIWDDRLSVQIGDSWVSHQRRASFRNGLYPRSKPPDRLQFSF